ncbi:PAS domain S-box protein [Chlorogloeopsis sp. ULAP01]|uniref:PAS domain-containing hybrid sensor histidine kinase/response regulator n=1 Tax=Chlorogloeopsis sp. ULAP01 TaxID=3056483 RepID=UPI0025AA600E|nr:PAS domain S-box protein [Chlorogloeopsis sp. ULAP01]MDM9385462.1 PAS domain S-box protein [Chlorogloeopsis sp. ULAP01]
MSQRLPSENSQANEQQEIASEMPRANSQNTPKRNEAQFNGVTREWVGINTDVTQNNQAQIAMHDSTAYLEQAIEYAPVAMVVFDREMRYLAVSRKWLQANNLTDDIIGRSHYEVFPDVSPEWQQIHQRCLAGAIEQREEDCYPRADGSVEWVRRSLRPWHTASGEIGGMIMFSENITQYKQAEAALRESKLLLRSILESTPDVIVVKDQKGDYIALNSNASNFLGKSVEEFIGKDDFELFPPDVAQELMAKDQQILATGAIETYEEVLSNGETSEIFFTTKAPWRDIDGSILGVIAVTRNITDRKRAEMALQHSEERFRTLTEATSQLSWTTNVEGEFTSGQTQWNAFTGQSFEELKGLGWLNAVHPDDQSQAYNSWSVAVTNKTTCEVEYRLRHHDGEYRHMSIRAVPLLNADGNIREWFGVHTDITERKQAEQVLRQTLEILDSASDAIIIRDMDDRIAYWNRGAELLYGWKKEEVIGQYIHTFLHTVFPKPLETVLTEFLQQGHWQGELHHTTCDGRHIIVASRWTLQRDGTGQPCKQLEINNDITERKQFEIALAKAKEAAEAASFAKSEFLANMSHELRTPLNGILGYAQILQRSKHLKEEERSRIDVIYQCGSHLLTLINDILDLSKIEAQKVELIPTDFHFPAFLQGVAEMCRIRAELKNIQFHSQLAPELPIGIHGDEKRLRQVLINLLSNAIKFTDAGSVTFTIAYASEGKIRFEVRDTGVGIPQEKLQAIFQPFEQVGDSRRQTEGTGLGLAISQRIVELMGSTIQVQSEVGIGSIFWFEVILPEADEWVKTSQADDKGQIIGIKDCHPKILVVDDKWANRSVIANLLSPIGFEVFEAENGQEGWEKILEFQPDLVLTDLLMPSQDGFALIKRIRNCEAFKDIAILVSSASVFESDRHRSLEVGGNDFLPKPVQAMELFQKLRKLLHLEWVYEEQKIVSQPEVNNAEMVAPPTAELESLHELAMKGNFKGIIKQAALLEQMDKKYIPFAKKMHQLAKGFQDQEILALIQSYK